MKPGQLIDYAAKTPPTVIRIPRQKPKPRGNTKQPNGNLPWSTIAALSDSEIDELLAQDEVPK